MGGDRHRRRPHGAAGGLVRVTLTLADNLDVIDADGNVITNADRTVEDQRLLAHLARLLPELDLGEDARAEHGLCLLDKAGGSPG